MIQIKDLINEDKRLLEVYPCNFYIPDNDSNLSHYTNGTCANGTEGCIFGQALVNLGASKSVLEGLGDEGAGIHRVLTVLGIEPNHKQLKWCELVQEVQDQQIRWGDILGDIHLTMHNYIRKSKLYDSKIVI